MLPVGVSALISILFLKRRFRDSLNPLFVKYFIIALFIPKIDCSLYFFLSSINFGNTYHFIFHSVFTGLFSFGLVYFFSEYKKNINLKIISKAALSGFFLSILLSILFNILPINHFWPILDKDLEFSFLSSFLFNQNSFSLIIPIYLILELLSLILYGKVLILKLIQNKGTAIEILRISKLIRFQKYLFIIFLVIFFVIYTMSLLILSFYVAIFSIFYLFIILLNIYITFKTNLIYND